ncbi:MAG: M28 family peptidase [Clostridia bacterium]|nr:M28 family peptidase [Clostridia bacterium]
MKFNKKIASLLLTGAVSACFITGAAGCIEDGKDPAASEGYAAECYTKLEYIDDVLSDRDCLAGKDFKYAQKWISWTLMQAGYPEEEIIYQPATFSRYYKKSAIVDLDTAGLKEKFSAVDKYEVSEKFYNKNGREYVEAEDGQYAKVDVTTPNICVTKKGKSDKQIIVGAHYDGDGTGDNGSGVSLALTTAEKVFSMNLEYTIKFVFFTAEEYGKHGSSAYANEMTEEEVANTLYMINLDSLVCGDYAYIYGGVQDNENKTVTQTEAYDNAMAVANSLGLSLKSNPWTWDNHAPNEKDEKFPSYAAPSTGNWSDHYGFKLRGIPYVYFEATNWEIPDYTGYGETYLVGMLMNTQNDYLSYIERYFPGRIMKHFETFSKLLYALVTQDNVNF